VGVCSWFPRHKTDTQIPSFYCPQYVPEHSKKYFLNPDKSHSQNLYLYKGSTSILPSPLKRKVKWLYVLYLTCWDCSHLSLPFCCNNCCWTRNDTIKWWNLCICFMSGKSGTNSHLPPLQWHTFLSLKTQLFCHFKGPVHHPCLTDLQYVPYMCFNAIFVSQCCAHISMTYMCFMLYICSNAKYMFIGIQCFNAIHVFQCCTYFPMHVCFQ
jgi:hypothetical protein